MDEKWYEILRQADKDERNNNRREEYKSYHLESYIDEVSGEEHDAWEMVVDKEAFEIETDICEKIKNEKSYGAKNRGVFLYEKQ